MEKPGSNGKVYTWNPITLRYLIKRWGWRSSRLALALILWIVFSLVCIQAGHFFVAKHWVRIPLSIGGWTLRLTIFPPAILCVIALFAWGLEWAIIPAYLSMFIDNLARGFPTSWDAVIALGMPLMLVVLAFCYRSLTLPLNIRSWAGAGCFVLVSFVANFMASVSSFVASGVRSASASSMFAAWRQWLLGDYLGGLMCVIPFMLLLPRWFALRERIVPKPSLGPPSFALVCSSLAGIGLIVSGFLAAASHLATVRLNEALANGAPSAQSARIWSAVTTWQIAAWWSIFIVVFLTLGTIGLTQWWSRRWRAQHGALEEARAQAETASQVKSDFLATVSHELRTPINGVLATNELLLGTNLTSEQREYALIVQESGQTLLHLINDILDISKIEAGKLELRSEPFNIRHEVQLVWRLLHAKAKAAGLDLRFEMDESVPSSICGDSNRVRQILLNLVSNALKFTPAGFVRVSTTVMERNGEHVLQWLVEDSGVGMSADTLSKLFQPFMQGDSSAARKFGGSGLGLSICKRLARAMGGDITATSVLGKGSTFVFTLPLSQAAHPLSPTLACPFDPREQSSIASVSLPSGLRVLVAEDNAINQKVARKMLEKLGCIVTLARDGEQAVNLMSTSCFDAIFMDCQMPIVDGFEATRRIRQMRQHKAQKDAPYIVALTANAMAGDRERCLAAGMDDYITKPFTQADLRAALARLPLSKSLQPAL